MTYFPDRILKPLSCQFLLMLVVVALGSTTAKAQDLKLAFSADGLTNSFEVTAGQTISIGLFLIQSGGETRLTDDGLITMGLQANFGILASNPTAAVPTIDPAFEGFPSAMLGSGFVTMEAGGPLGGSVKETNNAIHLADLHFSGVLAGDTMTISLDQFGTAGFRSNSVPSEDLNPAIDFTGTATLSTVAVPEPGSGSLLLLLASSLAVRRSRAVGRTSVG